MIGLRRKCWQIKHFLLQILHLHNNNFQKGSIFERKQRQKDDNMFCKQRQMAIMDYFIRYKMRRFIRFALMWLEFISLMFSSSSVLQKRTYFETVLQVPLFEQRKRENLMLLLHLYICTRQWLEPLFVDFSCFICWVFSSLIANINP